MVASEWFQPSVLLALLAGLFGAIGWSIRQDRRIEDRATKNELTALRDEVREKLHERATTADMQRHGFSLEQAHRAIAVVQTQLGSIRDSLSELHKRTEALPDLAIALRQLTEMAHSGRCPLSDEECSRR